MKNQILLFITMFIMNPALLFSPAYAVSREMNLQKVEKRVEKKEVKRLNLKITVKGEIVTIGSDSLTVKRGDKTIAVNIDANTKLVRRFGGTATLSEFSVGNKVEVGGSWTDESKTVITATRIRDISISKVRGTFVGKVTTKGGNSFTIEPVKRTTQTVFVSSATKYFDRKKNTIIYDNIKIGDQVQVRGVWDKSNNKIMEVSEVRNLSIPKPSPKPTRAL